MNERDDVQKAEALDRRRFLRMAALGGAVAAAWAVFRGGLPLGKEKRPLSSDLPGEGSIFQPRNDPRILPK